MDFNELEIDNYDQSTCPFNSNHRMQTPDSFKFHIARCKDREFIKIKPFVVYCPHNVGHVYVDKDKLAYHVSRCPSHPYRTLYRPAEFGKPSEPWVFNKCQYNPNHQIRNDSLSAMDRHLRECPNKHDVYTAPPIPVLDQSLSGKLNYSHGLITADDAVISSPLKHQKIEPLDNSRNLVVCHFIYKQFTLWKSNSANQKRFDDLDLWLDRTCSADIREWPGLREIESTRSHSRYFVANLFPNESDAASVPWYRVFIKMLTQHVEGKPPCRMAISTQSAYDRNNLYLVVHRSEDSGFGACLRESEIGLFCLPATLMYGKSDTLMELQSHLNLKLASEKKLEQDLFRSQEQIAKICQERNDLQIQVNSLKFEFENRWKTEFQTKIEEKEREVFDLRIKTEALIMNLKTDYDSQLQRFAEDLDRERREKEANRMNYESDLQNVKNQQKRNKEALLEHTDKVRKEIEDKNARLAYMQRQLDEKVTQEKELFEENQRLVRQTFDMQKMVEDQQGADVQLWLEEQRMVERENIEREYQDRELCIICMSEKKNTVFVPCGHLMYCNICLNNMNLPIGKKIPKNHQQSKCSCCDARVKIIHRAYPY